MRRAKKKTFTMSELRVDPDNMDRAMRAVADGATSKTPNAPVNVTEFEGGLYLIDGHHRVAAMALAEEDLDVLLQKPITALVTTVSDGEDWPYGLSEEMGPENWVSFEEWAIGR
jgi:hypothetical protein